MVGHDMGSRGGAEKPGRQNGPVRAQVTTARRIVVKVGSSSLPPAAGGLDRSRVGALVAALAAALVHADLLVLLSDVDGLYTGDPTKPGARRIPDVAGDEDLAGVATGKPGRAGLGTGGMATKLDAARIATHSGVAVVLTSAPLAAAALAGEEVGTFFHRVR